MGLFSRLFGNAQPARPAAPSPSQAEARYRYLLETAPPEQIEAAHREAFDKLTPELRQEAATRLNAAAPDAERLPPHVAQDSQALARLATRTELRQPGTLERIFGHQNGPMGGMLAGTLLTSIAGAFVGSMLADQVSDFFSNEDAPAAEEGDNSGFDGGDDSFF